MQLANFHKHLKALKRQFFRRLSKASSILFHPIFIFVVLQIVSISLTVIWVIWYVKQANARFLNSYDVAFLVTGCILTGIILLGTVVLFVFAIKQSLLNKQQRTFVSSVTHELRSPIASMQLSLETLETQKLDENTHQKLFGMMRADMNRLVNLVDQILVSARLDRGIKIFNQIEHFKLRSVFNAVIERLSNVHRDIRTRVSIECSDSLELLAARPAVDLIMSNLLENALKYSPSGTPIIISAEHFNEYTLIAIEDHGFGLDKRERKRIFKLFNRGSIATKNAIPGTGLGLYIVRSAVKVLGGSVWAESPGHGMGSTFYVRLPTSEIRTQGAAQT